MAIFAFSFIKVAILDLNHDKGLQLQESLERQYGSGKVIFIRCDVSSKSQMKGIDQNNNFNGANMSNNLSLMSSTFF